MVRRNTIGNTAEEINLDFLHEQLLLAMKKIKISDGSIDKDTVLREITAYYERKFSSLTNDAWSIPTAVSHPIPPDQSGRTSEEQPDFRCGSRTFCGIRQPASFLPCIQKRLWGPTQCVSESALFPHRKMI